MTKEVEVRMEAFMDGAIRTVQLPEWNESMGIIETLESVFWYGQNELQPVAGMPSVSIGDIVLLAGAEWEVSTIGFTAILGGN